MKKGLEIGRAGPQPASEGGCGGLGRLTVRAGELVDDHESPGVGVGQYLDNRALAKTGHAGRTRPLEPSAVRSDRPQQHAQAAIGPWVRIQE